jgi:trehalose 6-phosphate synthase/phosphatase
MKDLNAVYDCDYLLCIGDGKTDEVVFQYLEETIPGCYTCTVGKKQTEARYYIDSVKDVQLLIQELLKTE